MSNRFDAFDHATNTAYHWLAAVAKELATEDRRYAFRVLRAWMHTLRDRLTVDAAARLGAQLPELLRGVYYDGWKPGKAPLKYGVDGYLMRFAWEARIPEPEAAAVAATVSDAMSGLLSPGQLDDTLALLPTALHAVVRGTAVPGQPIVTAEPVEPEPGPESVEDVLADLRARVDTLTAAVQALARRGTEGGPGSKGPGTAQAGGSMSYRSHT
jgi:uncharacterized protein (DUF2267 family)